MRAAGSLLTVLALLAVQAPWVACTCEETAACTPLLTAPLLGDGHEHEHQHAQGCCDVLAHAVHGRRHAHRRHCHGAVVHSHAHEHGHHDEGAPPERHDGFRLSYVALSAPVSLETPAAPSFLAVVAEGLQGWPRLERGGASEHPEPPGGPRVPDAACERLLL
jgi:hypothetical protein